MGKTNITRTGKKKPTYELLDLQPLTTAPLASRDELAAVRVGLGLDPCLR